jgi:hypothetical protein
VALELHFSGHIGPDAMSAHRHRETECEVMNTFERFAVGSIARAVRDVLSDDGVVLARKGDLGEVIEVIREDCLVNVRWERTGCVYAPDAALDIVPVLE